MTASSSSSGLGIMFCTVCGTLNQQETLRCDECGARFGRDPRPSMAQDGSHRTSSRLLVVALAVIPLALAVLILAPLASRELDRRQIQAAAYGHAESAQLLGDLETAQDGFAALGSYRDAPERSDELEQLLVPLELAVRQAEESYAAQDFESAIQTLEPVVHSTPAYAAARQLLERSREALAADLLRTAGFAETDRDWLRAEQALTRAAALQPGDDELEERLGLLIREHAAIVYARAGAIYIAGPTGQDERALTGDVDAAWPVWSPDRTRIAFVVPTEGSSRFDGTLMVMNADGTDVVEVASRVLPFSWPAWSPDGEHLAYASVKHFDEESFTGRISLQLVDVATQREIDLTGSRVRHVTSPSWSPDGDQIAFISFRMERRRGGGADFLDGDTYVVNTQTRAMTNVTNERVTEEGWVIWSPAGDRLLLFTTPGDWTNPRTSQLLLLDIRTGTLTEIETDVPEISLPAWSPDGTKLAYVTSGDTVRVWSDRGEEWIRVEDEIAPYLSWSPDGEFVLAPGVNKGSDSYLLPMSGQFGERRAVQMNFADFRGSDGPPVWAPRTEPSGSHFVSVGGTALDRPPTAADEP